MLYLLYRFDIGEETEKNTNSVKHLKEFNQSFLPIKIVNSNMNSITNFINISRSIHTIIIKSNIFYKTFVLYWTEGVVLNPIKYKHLGSNFIIL